MSISCIIFDLDGVLTSTKELHFLALNKDLSNVGDEYFISKEEHLKIYDGLPTKKKLKLLSEKKGLPSYVYEKVWFDKQQYTIELLESETKFDPKVEEIFKLLRFGEYQYKLYIATNCIRATTKKIIDILKLEKYIEKSFCNEDIKYPKPHSEIYLRCILDSGYNPKECLIIEDSVHGIKAANQSGAHVLIVKNPEDLTLKKILNKLNGIDDMNTDIICNPDLNILIPMAGLGSRFERAGYTFPKPLIDVKGKPMIQWVIESLKIKANYIYLVRKEHCEKYNVKQMLNLITPGCKFVEVDKLTEGAACTCLLAKDLINNDKELMIVNSDQYIEWDPVDFFYLMQNQNVDGGVLTFESVHSKWSFAKADENNIILEVAEKLPISNKATTGCYYWRYGSDFVRSAESMINKNIRVNSEFYVCPTINELIQEGKIFKIYDVEEMWSFGVPEDLQYFLTNYK